VRVLTVGNFYPPHHHGGYELIWQGTVRWLRAHGHEVRVLASDHHEAGRSAEEEDDDVHRELRMYWRDYGWPRLPIRERVALERRNHAVLRRHVDELRPDVLSWWGMGGMSLSLIEGARRLGLPACSMVCDDWMDYAFRLDGWIAAWGTKPPLVRRAAAAAFGVPTEVDPSEAGRWLFISAYSRDKARATGGWALPDAPVCHSGIESDRFPAHPARPSFAYELVYVGRLDPRKGIATAIDALEHLPPQATLRLVGTGADDDVRTFRAQAARFGDRVTFADQVQHDRLHEVFAGGDVVLFPVEWPEPWGLVPIEAMAVGRPVVATGTGGSAEFLRDGENCLRFAAGDAAGLAAAVERLAADAGLRVRLREGGSRTATTYTQAVFNAQVEEHLRQCAS
jgi:glycosyltransferase involved in cell wall biosynthesis